MHWPGTELAISRSLVRCPSHYTNRATHVHCVGEKPYRCKFAGCGCGRRFTDASDRNRHSLVHATGKLYVCRAAGCDKSYTYPSSLRKHVKTHQPRQDPGGDESDDGSVDGDATAAGYDDLRPVGRPDPTSCDQRSRPTKHDHATEPSPIVVSPLDRKQNDGGGARLLPVYSNIDDWYVGRQAVATSGFGGLGLIARLQLGL